MIVGFCACSWLQLLQCLDIPHVFRVVARTDAVAGRAGIVDVERNVTELDIFRCAKVETFEHFGRVGVTLGGDQTRGIPTVVLFRIVARIDNIVVILALVCPGLDGSERIERHELLQHNVRKGTSLY